MYKYIIIALISILIIFAIVNQVRYSKLKQEYLTLQLDKKLSSDSLNVQNKILAIKVNELSDSLHVYTNKVDSLKRIKQKIVVIKQFKESENISDGVLLLKQNLQCEKNY